MKRRLGKTIHLAAVAAGLLASVAWPVMGYGQAGPTLAGGRAIDAQSANLLNVES